MRSNQPRLAVLITAVLGVIAGARPLSAQTAWTQLAPTGGPPAVRLGHTALADSANNRLIVFGGQDGFGIERGDTWVLSNADGQSGTPAWTLVAASGPSARGSHAAAYDAASNKMMVFGGNPNIGFCFNTTNDVWVLTNANGLGSPAWTQLSPTGTPPSRRSLHSAVYDPGSNRLVVFGGHDACTLAYGNDVWVLTNANGQGGAPQWIALSPTGVAIPGRQSHSAVYDSVSNRMIVFGGTTGNAYANDVWVLTNANGQGGTPAWQQLAPVGAPPAQRQAHSAVYDAATNRMLLFGGLTPAGNLNDVWTLSNANGLGTPRWRQQTPSGTPPGPRHYSAAGYIASSRRLVVHGGQLAGGVSTLNDVWAYADTPAAGVMQFELAAPRARESTGTAFLSVLRSEGTVGAVTVTHTTSNGTATSPSDYAATVGTTEFADGESLKVIALSLVADASPEPHETFAVTLSAPTGGAALGSPATATVTILDDSTASPPSWSAVGRLGSRREFHTATLLPDGRVLVAGGLVDNAVISSAELYDPATGTWSPAGTMSLPRVFHTAALLPSGKVLVAGGRASENGNPLRAAELFDPRTGAWSTTGLLVTARDIFAATLLPTGRVLVSGGSACYGCPIRLASAELYDPGTGTWASTGAMGTARSAHAMTVLATGRVLVAGGFNSAHLASCELYDPATGLWSPTGAMAIPRTSGHTTTALVNGKVLVAGGSSNGTATAAVQLYDPGPGTWTNTASLSTARTQHQATLLPSGLVLIAGGAGPIASTETYDPTAGTWLPGPPLTTPRAVLSMTLLASGKVLVAGGSASAEAELLDPAAGSWSPTGSLATARSGLRATLLADGRVFASGAVGASTTAEIYNAGAWTAAGASIARWYHTQNLLPDGRVLAAGGRNLIGGLTYSQVYDPTTSVWSPITSQAGGARFHHTATVLPSGKVLVAGGENGSNPLLTSELYDPVTGAWSMTGSLATARHSHTATLLPDGRVLVAGGYSAAPSVHLSSAEVYDPATGTWSPVLPMTVPRYDHTATLLPNGTVLVAGGIGYADDGVYLDSAEILDPASAAWTPTGALNMPRHAHTATLLPSGRVLLAGGFGGGPFVAAEAYDPATGVWTPVGGLGASRHHHAAALLATGRVLVTGGTDGTNAFATSELFDESGALDARRPAITSGSTALTYGVAATFTGTRFRGDSEASSGIPGGTAVNFPLLQLRSLGSDRVSWPRVDPRLNFSDEPMTLTVSELPPGLDAGLYSATVFTAGMPSVARLLSVTCSVAVTQQPSPQIVALGAAATFTVAAQGARTFQWQKDGIEIAGARAASYTTPPVSAADSGSTYRVVVGGNCASVVSNTVALTVVDGAPPQAAVLSPRGGEYLLLSPLSGPPNTHLMSWSMADDVRICQVEIALLYSNDGGASYAPAPAGGGLPAIFGPGGACSYPGEGTTGTVYAIPATFPSGVTGSLYKLRVTATDQSGLVTVATSPNPFYVVQANPDSVRTLILHDLPRMQAKGIVDAAGAVSVSAKLRELAAHPRVQGFLVDLSTATDLVQLLSSWDAAPAEAARANAVLFGCHGNPLPTGCTTERDGIHDTVRELRRAYTGVRSIVLVGDDRVIPFARVPDGASLLPESTYAGSVDLGATSTVAQALEANHFLSDDPIGIADPIGVADLASELLIPDVALGRLVETAAEITTTIATFISQDGVLDLEALPQTGHKTLVTGYDFLDDSARKVRRRWKQALGAPPGQDADLAPVDGVLLGGNWGIGTVAGRISALRTHLSGNGAERYGVMSLSGHATHYEEGVPGETGPLDIQGLGAIDIHGADACSAPSPGALSLAGGVIYAVGCHGGLTVPGSCATDTDHSLDLPQTFLSRGVVAYVANTGYGWGLKHGIGYGERLSELFTEQMTKGGTVAVGEAVKAAKQRYFLESPRVDVYDKKSLMQWTLYGLPMYAVRTGLESAASLAPAPSKPRSDGVEEQRLGAVTVESRVDEGEPSAAPLPDYLTSLSLHFNFSAPGVYVKRDSSGRDATENPALGNPGCPDLDGCYYTLNGLVERSTGHTDLPVQPYFVYDSRLSGTSQHGVLWTGGVYVQETGWRPVIAQLASNGTISTDHGAAARRTMIGGVPRGIVPGVNPDNCRPSDLEVNTLVITTGEASKVLPTDATYTIERRMTQVDLEAFYFNDTSASASNCDRTPPELGTGPFAGKYHRAVGTTLSFAVPVTDASSVWRVMVVTDDEQANGLGQQTWDPLELDLNAGTGRWEGSLTVSPSSRVTYVVQAVDRRGNVVFAEYVAPVPPASGVDLGILDTVDAPTVTGISPANGPVGTTVTVIGRNLIGATSVKVGGAAALFSNVTETSLQLVVPASAAPGAVEVTTGGGLASSAGTYGVQAPTALTQSATSVSLNGATLNGSVNPNGLATSVHFDYGTTTSYGLSTSSQSVGSGGTVTVSDVLSGLACGTTYHYRVVALNAQGTALGSDVSFDTTACPPTATTSPASAVAVTAATLHGAVNPRGNAADARFEYGPTTAYGFTTSAQAVGSGKVDVAVSEPLTGIACGTEYHYRAVGTSPAGTRTGGDVTFTTGGCSGLTIGVEDVVVREGNAPEPSRYRTAEVVLRLSANSPGGVSVNYLAGPGSAAEGTDFVATSGTLAFAAGERTGTIRIPIVGDGDDETTESFALNLTSPIGVSLGDPQGVVTIVDDDGNTTAPNAHFVMIGETQSDSLSATRTEAWFKAALTSGRSYAVYAWAGHAGADEVAGGSSLAASVFLDDGTTMAPGVVSHADHQAATSGHAGVLRTIIPAGTGTFRLKVSAASTPSAPYEIHVMLVETTLVAPYWQVVIAAGFDAAPQIRNNTPAPVTVQFTAYAPDGTVQCSTGLTIPANGISTFAMGGPAPGCGTTVGFGSAQLAHHGPPGAITGNITTFGAASGLSFDAPFVPRNRWTSMGTR